MSDINTVELNVIEKSKTAHTIFPSNPAEGSINMRAYIQSF